MKNILMLGLSAALAVTACSKADSNASSSNAAGAASGASGATPGGGAAASGELGPASLEVSWTGKYDPSDPPGEEHPLMRVTNKDATRPLTFYQGFFYFYDHDKKQIGREFRDRYQFSLKPGQTTELGAGPRKSELPKGTEHMEFVVTGANFGSEAAKFRVATPPPDKRPMGG